MSSMFTAAENVETRYLLSETVKVQIQFSGLNCLICSLHMVENEASKRSPTCRTKFDSPHDLGAA